LQRAAEQLDEVEVTSTPNDSAASESRDVLIV
jgi:hypothetical protein